MRPVTIVCLFTALLAPASAQNFARLRGTVTDPQALAVTSAEVTLSSAATGLVRTQKTNAEGRYLFVEVDPGLYSLTVTANGFRKQVQENIKLETAQLATLDCRLQVGSLEESVTVTASRVMINQDDTAVGAVVDRQFVENLPLNGRSLQALFTMTPGVVLVASGTGPLPSNLSQLSVNGQRDQSNIFTVDGVSANVGIGSPFGGGAYNTTQASGGNPAINALGGTQSMVMVDALEDFKAVTATYSAEYGTSPGGQFLLTTRSGTNRLHGSVYEYLRNEAFDANGFFNNRSRIARAQLRQNQPGAVLGGPVVIPHLYDGHNKTFFFAGFENLRLVLPQFITTNVPTAAVRAEAPPAIQRILNVAPVPNGPAVGAYLAQYMYNARLPDTVYAGNMRVDQHFSSSVRAFFRYNQSPSDNVFAGNLVSTRSATSLQTATGAVTWILSPALVNDARFNWSASTGSYSTATPGLDISPYLPAAVSSEVSFGFLFGSSNVGFRSGSEKSNQHQWEGRDALTWKKGAHSLTAGFDLRWLTPAIHPYGASTSYVFQTGSPSSPDFLTTGLLNFVQATVYRSVYPRFANYSAFMNDSWKIARTLTVNAGLRWDLTPIPAIGGGLTPYVVVNVLPNVANASFAQAPPYQTRYANFAPRLGVAWVASQTPGWQTVFRLGAGLFCDVNNNTAGAAFANPPFSNSVFTISGASGPYKNGVPFPAPASVISPTLASTPASGGNIAWGFDPHLNTPVTYQWSAAVEQALGHHQSLTVTYVGNGARHLLQNTAFYPLAKINPLFTAIYYTRSVLTSSYNALQVQFQRKLSRGLQAFGGYTWSHSIDDTLMDQSTSTSNLFRGNSDADYRHVAHIGVTYEIPSVSLGPVLEMIGRNWGLDMNIAIQSGAPFTVYSSLGGQLPNGIMQTIYPNVNPGVAQWVRNANAPGGWEVSAAALSIAPNGAQGNLGRNIFRGFPVGQGDIALRRSFHLSERFNLQFRAEAFNLTNHSSFGGFTNNAYMTAPLPAAFGQASSSFGSAIGGLNSLYQIGGPRSLQFAVKLIF